MKTIFIDIADNRAIISGFLLSQGYNFRLLDFVQGDKSNKVFVVETGTKREETALKEFLKQAKVSVSLVVDNANKAGLKGKKLGTFTEIKDMKLGFSALTFGYWLDKTTGKKYEVV